MLNHVIVGTNDTGMRASNMGPLHLAYVRDPDGHKLCAIHRPG